LLVRQALAAWHGLALARLNPEESPRGNTRGNIHPVRCVHIVRAARRHGRCGGSRTDLTCGLPGLRAWSGITGWRFESSSAHHESPANAGLSSLWASLGTSSWQQLLQHCPHRCPHPRETGNRCDSAQSRVFAARRTRRQAKPGRRPWARSDVAPPRASSGDPRRPTLTRRQPDLSPSADTGEP
jgi:hypothetical protein